MNVAVVDYGLGNVGSVLNMLRRLGVDSRLVTTAHEVSSSDRLILPGVGAFDNGMRKLSASGLDDSIRVFAATERPLLGICLGMQMLLDRSEEGELHGLQLIDGHSKKFAGTEGVRVPHMGWNLVKPTRPDDELLAGLSPENRFYFVHSYFAVPDSPAAVLATTDYAGTFTSMLRVDNVWGAQYHPEKSHNFGMRVLKNFSEL